MSNPKHVGLAILNVSPGKPIYIDHKILLPGGYGGLLEVEFTLEKKMFNIHIGMRDIYV